MAIFVHVMNSSSILHSDHVRLTYKVCTYPGPLDILYVIVYSILYMQGFLTLLVSINMCTLWDSVCTNTLNTVYTCIVHNMSILIRDTSWLNSSGESL